MVIREIRLYFAYNNSKFTTMFWLGLIIVGGAIMAVVLAWQLLCLIFSFLGFILELIIGCFED